MADKLITEYVQKMKTFANKNAASLDNNYNKDTQYGSYTTQRIRDILKNNNAKEQRALSEYFYANYGVYKRLVSYWATLIRFDSILIPIIKEPNKGMSKKEIKSYKESLDLLEKLQLKVNGPRILNSVIKRGAFYGVIQKDSFLIQELPDDYCRNRLILPNGLKVVEMNMEYFDTIRDKEVRQNLLSHLPKEIVKGYNRYKKVGNSEKWLMLEPETSMCFYLTEAKPFLVDLIGSLIDYIDTKEISKTRYEQELNYILSQRGENDKDGNPIYTLDELSELHEATAAMLQSTKGINVITSPLKLDLLNTKSSESSIKVAPVEEAISNIYNESGVSKELFASDSTAALSYSINEDIATLLPLINEMSLWITTFINSFFTNYKCNIEILPISELNKKEYQEMALKNAQFGYSSLLPAISMGLNQNNLINLKVLENNVLNLSEVLIPLHSSHTNGGTSSNPNREMKAVDEGGATPKEDKDLSDKTIQNKESE